MKGIFIKRRSLLPILWSAFFILAGTVIAVRFGIWGINAIKEAQIATAIFSFGFMLLGLCFGSVSILIFNFNRKASFETDGKDIHIVCGFGTRYDLSVDDMFDVSLRGNILLLTTESERITISNLENAKDICDYLRKFVAQKTQNIDYEKEKQNYESLRKKLIIRIVPTVIAAALMFAHVGWCVWLTEGKELSEFTSNDNMIFVAFALAEAVTLVAAFWLAKLCGKVVVMIEESKKRMDIANAQMHRKDSLEKYAGVISVKYFDGGRYRIVIFSPNGDVFGYMLEAFDNKESRWNMCYDKAKGFNKLSDLYDDIEDTFSDVIMED